MRRQHTWRIYHVSRSSDVPHTRGGNFYAGRTTNFPRQYNRAYGSPYGRTVHTGQRHKFAVSQSETGGHQIELSDGELANLSIAEDGSMAVTVANKPTENGNGEHNGNDAKPAEAVRHSAAGPIGKMSWIHGNDGSVTFVPNDNETLAISSDAIFATVTAAPAPVGTIAP
jgi:hypothetical protein